MIRKLILTLSTVALAVGAVKAQSGRSCATSDFHQAQIALHPEIAIQDAALNAEIDRYLSGKIASGSTAKTAFDASDATKIWPQDVTEYHIPVVFHVIYDNAGPAASVTDNQIYELVKRINSHYNATDTKLGNIITPFKPYIGNAHITFHLANTDPNGKPTHGIVREFAYATNGGDESAKIGQWPPNQYLNIYLENVIGRGTTKGIVQAYATFPTDYSSNPYAQGVISRADQVNYPPTFGDEYTISHEIGHFLYLYHPWNNNGKDVEDTVCGDDEVDDTPPTYGHFSCTTAKLYDTGCSRGYFVDYDSTTFYHMLGQTGIITSNVTADPSPVQYNDSLAAVIGQSFTTGSSVVPLQGISVRVDTGVNNGGITSATLYNAGGTIILGSSTNTPVVSAGTLMTYNFPNTMLAANTTYKFVINKLGGNRRFPLNVSTANPYSGGVMYTGASANVPVPGSDLYFIVTQLRRIDYPDTTNTQNIMDYSACSDGMFSKGQVARMRTALRSEVGNRNNLIDTANLIRTGVMDASGNFVAPTDIPPIALFTVTQPFTCENSSQGITFTNRSYNDTIAAASWMFNKSANPSLSGITSVNNTFNDTGWVTVSLTVTGNGAGGTDTYTRNDLVYVADPTAIASNYIEDFNPSSPLLGRYPIFNYFKNPSYNWQLNGNAGVYDKTSIKFSNYDPRDQGSVTSGQALNTATQSPRGLYADFYTPGYDLTTFGGNCFLDFYSAGAYRTSKTSYMNDTLLISYSINCGVTWSKMGVIVRGDLANNGYRPESFVPTYTGEWKEQSITVPSAARSSNLVYFRFRYLPGTDNAYRNNGLDFGTGNNFYLDRLGVTANPLGVQNGVIMKLGMSIQPNPTSGSAIIRLNGGDNSTADVNITDVTGKLVYHTSAVRKATTTEIEIPTSAISVKGMYLVHVVTNGATETQKLIAY